VVDISLKGNELDIRLLVELSTGYINLRELSKKFGRTPEGIRKRLKRLERAGLVKNVGGKYVLTDEGRKRVEYARASEEGVKRIKEIIKRFKEMLGIDTYILERIKVTDEYETATLYATLTTIMIDILQRIASASLHTNIRDREKILNTLWNEIKPLAELAIVTLSSKGKEGWEIIENLINVLMGVAFFNSFIAVTIAKSEGSQQ